MAIWRLVLKLASFALLPGAVLPAAATDLRDVRMYPSREYTRLVVELGIQPSYRLLKLDSPARLVLDVNAKSGDELLEKMRLQDLGEARYLLRVRSARHDEEKVRIVFDLAEEVSYSLFALEPVAEYGDRVVLDLAPKALRDNTNGLLRDLGFSSAQPREERPAPKPSKSDRDFLVVIDAGHGGEDPGAVNRSGVREKSIVLDIARRLHARLKQIPGIDPQLTRSRDIFLPLATRVRIAQDADADLFLSIHADSFDNPKPRGASVFVLSKKGASSKLAKSLAVQANLSDRIGGINASSTTSNSVEKALTFIFTDGKERASRSFAAATLDSLSMIGETHGSSVHSAGFAVLKSPVIPSVLIEVGFISNPEDAKLLVREDYRARLAEQIAAAVVEYSINSSEDD